MSDGNGARGSAIAGALALGACGILAATVFGLFFYHARDRDRTVQVTGAASQSFDSDIAKWRVTLARQVGPPGLGPGYDDLRRDVDGFVSALVSAGVAREDVEVQPVSSFPMYGREGEATGYTLQQSLYVVSDRPEILEEIAAAPGSLLGGGAFLQNSQLEYFYSAVDSLKVELLAAATRDAERRAREIVGSSGGELDHLMAARAGVFQITEPYSTEVSSFGVYATTTRRKEIKVTVHATYAVR